MSEGGGYARERGGVWGEVVPCVCHHVCITLHPPSIPINPLPHSLNQGIHLPKRTCVGAVLFQRESTMFQRESTITHRNSPVSEDSYISTVFPD